MLTLVAFVVRQFSTTDWPISIANGSAEMLAVGAGMVVSGAIAEDGGRVDFLWQPVTAIAANAAALSTMDFQVNVCFEIISSSFAFKPSLIL